MKPITESSRKAGLLSALLALATILAIPCALAQGTAFTYQGQLDDGGNAAYGSYDMEFKIWNASVGGAQVGGTATYYGIPVDGGLFDVELDYGSGIFTGAARWLEIGVQTNGGGGFTTLSPRTEFTSSPYAIAAISSQTAASVPSDSIGSSEVANDSLTSSDLGPNSVGTSEVIDNSLTANDLAAGSVASSEVLNDSLTVSDLAPNSVYASEIAANAVGASEIATAAVGTSEVADGSLTTSDLNLTSIDTRYVQVAGDTMTDKLTIHGSTGLLDLKANSNDPLVQFYDGSGSRKAWMQAFGSDFFVANDLAGDLRFRIDNIDRLVVDNSGRVGVGRDPAEARLEVQGVNTNNASEAVIVANSLGAKLFVVENNGQVGVGVSDSHARLQISGDGVDPALRVQNIGSTKFSVNPNGGTTIGTYSTTGSPDNGLYVSGNMTIGTTATGAAVGYKVSVDGKIACEEVLVQDSGSWPDYVFADDYNLLPLGKVEAHIKANSRLPGIPSAETIAETGIPVGQMQKQMMEKIEELTLYILEQDKRIAELEGRMAEYGDAK